MSHMDKLGKDFLQVFLFFILNCQMRNLIQNQDLLQILLMKVNRDVFFSPFNKIYFHNPPKQFKKIFQKYLGGKILAFYNFAIFDKYSDLRASPSTFD